MSTITIPAREVKAGDVIDFGGMPATIVEADVNSSGWAVLGIKMPDDQASGGWWHRFASDASLTVTRPDPDAELVEVMAKADCGVWNSGDESWNGRTEESHETYRAGIRAALAAAREAGLL